MSRLLLLCVFFSCSRLLSLPLSHAYRPISLSLPLSLSLIHTHTHTHTHALTHPINFASLILSWTKQHGVPMPRYMDTPTEASVREAGEVFGYPLMLKAKRMAYDGKGNAPVMDKVRGSARPISSQANEVPVSIDHTYCRRATQNNSAVPTHEAIGCF